MLGRIKPRVECNREVGRGKSRVPPPVIVIKEAREENFSYQLWYSWKGRQSSRLDVRGAQAVRFRVSATRASLLGRDEAFVVTVQAQQIRSDVINLKVPNARKVMHDLELRAESGQ